MFYNSVCVGGGEGVLHGIQYYDLCLYVIFEALRIHFYCSCKGTVFTLVTEISCCRNYHYSNEYNNYSFYIHAHSVTCLTDDGTCLHSRLDAVI